MAVKEFNVPDIGTVNVYKRRGSKSIRISVDHEGHVRVTLPLWAPYRAAMAFVTQKRAWILQQKSQRGGLLESEQRIGKYHTLQFQEDPVAKVVRTRVTDDTVYVYHPLVMTEMDSAVQKSAMNASQKALRKQAEQLLPQRLQTLAQQYGFSYKSVTIRNLKTRWGSCNSHKEITLNYYLMQLPWRLIDYVLVHELAHTKHLNHSSEFWAEVGTYIEDYKIRRAELKKYQPSVLSPDNPARQ